MELFVKTLKELTGVSEEYAIAAWFTLSHSGPYGRLSPVAAAKWYIERFDLAH